ncbi:hypothetical protein OUZ56_017783 [Daphnia magna]|uniref:Uncharacterized protein n=1 Tax=Daphnia magna TaxID=35525 RepID=A0ABR0ATS3_9CRUS|nr:hypothetical protein OUZ56_017783 [Daphnia magna]
MAAFYGIMLLLAVVSLMAGWTMGVPMDSSSSEYGSYSYQTTTAAPYYTTAAPYNTTTYAAPSYYTTKAPEYYPTTYAAPTYYTEAPKYYSTKAPEYYTHQGS